VGRWPGEHRPGPGRRPSGSPSPAQRAGYTSNRNHRGQQPRQPFSGRRPSHLPSPAQRAGYTNGRNREGQRPGHLPEKRKEAEVVFGRAVTRRRPFVAGHASVASIPDHVGGRSARTTSRFQTAAPPQSLQFPLRLRTIQTGLGLRPARAACANRPSAGRPARS